MSHCEPYMDHYLYMLSFVAFSAPNQHVANKNLRGVFRWMYCLSWLFLQGKVNGLLTSSSVDIRPGNDELPQTFNTICPGEIRLVHLYNSFCKVDISSTRCCIGLKVVPQNHRTLKLWHILKISWKSLDTHLRNGGHKQTVRQTDKRGKT